MERNRVHQEDCALRRVARPDYDSVLAEWKGSSAQLWLFHVTHDRLLIRLHFAGKSDSLYVLGVECIRICGPFTWDFANLKLSQEGDAEDPISLLSDREAGFELSAYGISLLHGPDQFMRSFDDMRVLRSATEIPEDPVRE